MKCLVTGAAGFVGSTLSQRLLNDGHEVCGIDSFLDYYPRKIKERNLLVARDHKNFKFIECSLLTADLASLLKDVEWIFHQAGQAGVRASWGQYFSTYTDNNILATQRLLESCKTSSSLKKLVYASSSSVYGDAESRPTLESALPRPVSPYGVTKLAAEHLVTLYASQFNVPTVSLRYFTVFGPRQRPDMAFHKFIKAALKKEVLELYGDGEQSRDFTFVDDIVEGNILAAKSGGAGAVYNIGGGTNATVNDFFKILREEIGALEIRREERQHGDARHTGADTNKARKELGYAPKVSLRDGILREIKWLETEISKAHL